MTWTKLDDGASLHPKLLHAGAEACWLWVAGLLYCNAHHLDGVIPRDLVPVLYPPFGVRRVWTLAGKLVAVRLWHERESAFEIHDFGEYQGTAPKLGQHTRRSSYGSSYGQSYDANYAGDVAGIVASYVAGVRRAKIYFCSDGSRVKIGLSKNPYARLAELRSSVPGPLTLIGHVVGTVEDLTVWHSRFVHLRLESDWFRLTDELASAIAESVVQPKSETDTTVSVAATVAATIVAPTVAATRSSYVARARDPVPSRPVEEDLDPAPPPIELISGSRVADLGAEQALAGRVHARFVRLYETKFRTTPAMGGKNVGTFPAALERTAKLRDVEPLALLDLAFERWAAQPQDEIAKRAPYAVFVARFGALLDDGSNGHSGPKSERDKLLEAIEEAQRVGDSAKHAQLVADYRKRFGGSNGPRPTA